VHLAKGYDLKDKSQMVPGFTTSTRTRPLIISKLETYMRERSPIIRSERLINELFSFIWNGSKAEAQRGYNDDLVMSYGIALWVRDTALKLRQQGMDLNRSALSGFKNSRNGLIRSSGEMSKKDMGWTQNIDGHEIDLTQLLNGPRRK